MWMKCQHSRFKSHCNSYTCTRLYHSFLHIRPCLNQSILKSPCRMFITDHNTHHSGHPNIRVRVSIGKQWECRRVFVVCLETGNLNCGVLCSDVAFRLMCPQTTQRHNPDDYTINPVNILVTLFPNSSINVKVFHFCKMCNYTVQQNRYALRS